MSAWFAGICVGYPSLVVVPERDDRHCPAGAVVLWCCGAVVLWCWLVVLRSLV
ncbi:hypothetical protein KX375_21995 [Escherichia coli]|uniref:Uncharacterized protein n=1 Tax=Escherichia coli TaxID=562 RepID=A0AAN3KRW5_ECOLX|nr:hypothetical protein [Escherichia coli]EEC8222394.1 hypothetical protein [Escherichia coli]EEC8236810.1 hypothetical protein [Escherichia coli]EEQ7251012.1 hypothetical protein [Escherichia coli]EEY6531481.1 hypothetical protein [Escherichia coli]EEY6809649.1 hypothetical protein [Escherichia coli]